MPEFRKNGLWVDFLVELLGLDPTTQLTTVAASR